MLPIFPLFVPCKINGESHTSLCFPIFQQPREMVHYHSPLSTITTTTFSSSVFLFWQFTRAERTLFQFETYCLHTTLPASLHPQGIESREWKNKKMKNWLADLADWLVGRKEREKYDGDWMDGWRNRKTRSKAEDNEIAFLLLLLLSSSWCHVKIKTKGIIKME